MFEENLAKHVWISEQALLFYVYNVTYKHVLRQTYCITYTFKKLSHNFLETLF